ncbi:hypothetical protein MMC32_008471 [Xylographa parallela]|nr:hypothetical protein [Xylographa parallela]
MEGMEYPQNADLDASGQLHQQFKITGTLQNSRHCPKEVKEVENMTEKELLMAILAGIKPERPQEDAGDASLKKENALLRAEVARMSKQIANLLEILSKVPSEDPPSTQPS